MQFNINKDPVIISRVFTDDGTFPNSRLPVIIYKNALTFHHDSNTDGHAASILEDLFKKNNWSNSWRNGIYDYHHYHSITHEVLGVYEGNTEVELGGARGIIFTAERGDVIIIPAGVVHRNVTPSSHFKCVGAYPGGSDYDIKKGDPEDRPEADKNIKKVALPGSDPVYGNNGLLMKAWK
jgi:uncharacterized protein YjlB